MGTSPSREIDAAPRQATEGPYSKGPTLQSLKRRSLGSSSSQGSQGRSSSDDSYSSSDGTSNNAPGTI